MSPVAAEISSPNLIREQRNLYHNKLYHKHHNLKGGWPLLLFFVILSGLVDFQNYEDALLTGEAWLYGIGNDTNICKTIFLFFLGKHLTNQRRQSLATIVLGGSYFF